MDNYICYVKYDKEDAEVIEMLSNVFNYKKEQIGNLFDQKDFEITFENRILDEISEFCTELNVYIPNNEITAIYPNNFLFGYQVSKYLNQQVLVSVSFENNDPYQYILIENDLFFIVDEVIDDNSDDKYGITVQKNTKIKISYNDAINFSS
ncbi:MULTISPECIES: hypothetical protein [Chryseobacterium]|uniref:Uncharacterized protein n=1 Tax=Chryseobacterium gambrini TaxID=373672 RepID=A0AAJ1VL47_9FLAO|nr:MULTISPECIES: hypothetical protein [Chryseobacterium]MDN4011254.1 hypothetical protein [Chryseobacterium gambrini]QWA38027.1 hypothetical protein KKI44_19375 [Chryseobacterium sp. ZHDP1]